MFKYTIEKPDHLNHVAFLVRLLKRFLCNGKSLEDFQPLLKFLLCLYFWVESRKNHQASVNNLLRKALFLRNKSSENDIRQRVDSTKIRLKCGINQHWQYRLNIVCKIMHWTRVFFKFLWNFRQFFISLSKLQKCLSMRDISDHISQQIIGVALQLKEVSIVSLLVKNHHIEWVNQGNELLFSEEVVLEPWLRSRHQITHVDHEGV